MGNDAAKPTKDEKECFKRQYGIPEEKFDMVMKSFKKHATGDGKISRDAFKKILAGVMHDELAEQVFDSFDRDGNNTMDVHEYLMMMGVTHGGTIEQKLRASFGLFDKNGDGVLSKEEVREMFILIVKQKKTAQMLRQTGAKPHAKPEPIDAKGLAAIDGIINTVFDKVDKDHNGVLDIDEFLLGFSEHPEVCGFFKQF
eukprot:m51a1_g364 hypothetical protein (199) ;mRNA; r:601183-602152